MAAATPPRIAAVPLLQSRTLQAALIVIAAVLVYLPAAQNSFAYDDVAIIQLDQRITDLDVARIVGGGYWQDSTSALYRPLTSLSYAVDWQLAGGDPAWFHVVNALWHAAVCALLLLLLHALAVPPAGALLGAAIFAFHPVHVEAVANVVGRAELMASTFTLAAALLFARHRALRSPRALTALVLLAALALLSKEGAVVLPAVLILVDVARRRLRPGRAGVWLRTRALPLAAVTSVLALYLLLRTAVLGTLTPTDLDASLEILASPGHRVFTALQAWPQYARLLFYPRVLLADYGPRILMPATTLTGGALLGGVLLLLCVAGGVLAWLRGRGLLAAALLWFPVVILPVSNLLVPIGVLVAERTLYLPSAALSIAVAALAGPASAAATRPLVRPLVVAATGAVLGLLVVRTAIRIPDWRTTNTVFFALVSDRPDAFRGTWHLARLAASRGDRNAAMQLHADAIRLWPYRPRLLREAIFYAADSGRPDWARQLSEFALERVPGDLIIRRFYAGTLLDQADTIAARIQIREGLKWHPQDSLLIRMLHAATPTHQTSTESGSQS